MLTLSRREFLQTSGLALAGVPFLSPKGWLSLLTYDDTIRYGFASDKVLARRQPILEATPFGFYQKGALLRYQRAIEDNDDWLKIINDTNLHDPKQELAHGDIYVQRSRVAELQPDQLTPLSPDVPVSQKRVEITLSHPQKLTAYEGSRIFRSSLITAGLWNTTPTGEFNVLWKARARYMQGSDYDLPGVPWVAYFTELGHALHGAYWRKEKEFGRPGSHGCINLSLPEANLIWRWAARGTRVIIHA